MEAMVEAVEKTVLVVDDESHIRRLIEFTLKKGRYHLVMAANGREALELAVSERPDLIILDVLMPEMDGIEALQHLKANASTAAIPVILLTGIGQSNTREKAEQEGTAVYLTKPFSPNKLLREVERMI